MTIEEIIATRDIKEIVHYTTSQGLLGILHLQKIKSRTRLSTEESLEFILNINTPKVFDYGWEDYVNLSITDINTRLYGYSTRKWHPNAQWRILAFDPVILTHEGAFFATTNNAYRDIVRRAQGPEGLEALFAPTIPYFDGRMLSRNAGLPARNTTCFQAEVLYLGELSTEHLTRVYASDCEQQDEICGQILATHHGEFEVVVGPSKFDGVTRQRV